MTERVSRRDLAEQQAVWLAHGLTFATLATASAIFGLVSGRTGEVALAAVLAACAVGVLACRAAPASSLRSHAALASVYVCIGLAEIAYAPDWWVPLGASMFIATLTSIRVISVRAIVGHLVAASLWLAVPAVALGASAKELAMLAALVAGVWTLTFAVVTLLRAAELQGRKLQDLLRVDPLTAVGNERLLIERLATELDVHKRARESFSIVAVDLTDFTGVNERLGRAMGDELLVRVAGVISVLVEPEATVARPLDDEFWILVPKADALAATQLVHRIRTGLASVAIDDPGEPALSAAAGVATYPRDGIDAAALLDTAHKRLSDDQQRVQPTDDRHASDRAVAEGAAEAPDAALRGLSRADLATHQRLWRYAQAVFATMCVLAALAAVETEGSSSAHLFVLGGFLLVTVVVVLSPRPPSTERVAGHALVAASYIATAAAFWALVDNPLVGLTGALFVAPFIAIRSTSRRTTIAHLVGATAAFVLAAGALLAAGDAERSALLSIALVAPAIWSLGLSCMFALELAERQGRRLEELVRTDYVTGIGNRIRLDEALVASLNARRVSGAPLALVAVEVVETFENSRQTSEELLRAAAEAVAVALGPRDLVTRRRGHEFVAMLPGADVHHAEHAARAIFASLSALSELGHRVECAQAVVSAPADGTSAAELLSTLDTRLENAGTPVPMYRAR